MLLNAYENFPQRLTAKFPSSLPASFEIFMFFRSFQILFWCFKKVLACVVLQLLVYYMNDNIKLEKDDFWVPMRKFFSPPMRNFESPRGIESQTFGFRAPTLWHPKVWGSIPHGLRIFSLSYARDKTKNFFLYFFTVLPFTISLILLQTLTY